MHTRSFGPGGPQVSEIGLGTWQLGGMEWGDVPEEQSLETLHAAADAGVTFIDTADVYGIGRSEQLIGRFLKERTDRDRFFVATKLGRRPDPGWPENFTGPVIRRHVEGSLARLGVDQLDLEQTHCLPPKEIERNKMFDHLRQLQGEGLIRRFGASVESMDEALACLEVEGLAALQIIFNVLRQKPIDELFGRAKEQGVALIVRLPLASGVLSGKFDRNTRFASTDHRNFNRDGQKFNVGETFAGVPFEKAVELADKLKAMTPDSMNMAQFALRWCLDFDAVTTVIPGATRPQQARDNATTSDLQPLSAELHERLADFYNREVKEHIRGAY